jgi:hypothetical protein
MTSEESLKKIIYLSCTPVSSIVGNKIDPWWFKSKGFEVEYWNVTKINYTEKALDTYFGGSPDYKFTFPNEIVIRNRIELEEKMSMVGTNSIIVILDFWQTKDLWIYALLKKYNLEYYLSPRTNAILYYPKKNIKGLFTSIVKSIHRGDLFSKVKESIFRYLYKYTNNYKKPSYVFVCGNKGKEQWINTQAKIYVHVPSPDILWKKKESLIKDNYCVYIDDGVTYSPDMALIDGKSDNKTTKNIEKYKSNISKIFDIIESTNKLKVVIAASGKIKYSENNIYSGKDVYYHKTNELIQNSSLVIGHCSSGILQVVVSKKPMILLLDETFIPEKNENIIIAGEALNIKPIWSSEFKYFKLESIGIDIKKYEIIVKDYLCSENCNVDYREIIYNCLMNHTQD